MIHLFYQEKLLNMSVYIPKSYEIDWELFIQDENERNLTKELYEKIDNIDQIDEYKANNPDIPEKIFKYVYAISNCGVADKYLKYNHPTFIEELFESEDIVRISFIGVGLLVFFTKGIFEYFS
jgi:hypothetical protein